MRFALNKNKAFTLIEIISVLAIMGIVGGVIYTVFITNWMAYENRLAGPKMLSDTKVIFDRMTEDGRNAQQIDLIQDSSVKTAVFRQDINDPLLDVTYTINDQGKLIVQRPEVTDPITMSTQIDFANSSFEKVGQGKGLKFNLSLKDQLFTRTIDMVSSSEVFPRN